MAQGKQEIITFKVDASLAQAMRAIPNRSAFIRTAVLAALENTCPLCHGSGMLSPAQQHHWQTFARNHAIAECQECHAFHLVCEHGGGEAHGEE